VEYELRIRGPDGTYRWFFTRAVAAKDKHGNVTKWYGVTTDIEDRKRSELERERFRVLEAELAHVNRVSTMGELTASLAHEITQPITAIVSNASAAVRWLERDQPDCAGACRSAKRILEDSARAAEIIDRIRSLYKKAPPRREPFDLNASIRDMLVLIDDQASGHAVSIRTALAPDLPETTADRVQLQQVLLNLMLNAIEAMTASGGELTVTSELDEDGNLRCSVSDTGVGLPTKDTGQIFTAFFTTKPQGTGMGLAISRSIIESHGGQLWAMANKERGATFLFTMPC
jgi:signal transduction histidine kinase